ncbi:hypothetical protein [Ciceribacter thiooxidans]|uniref:Uncharacterized protein n=1 Tax=Ciceribacter thiooxidans TaxID=1969821 RepID=A0ABV7IBE8_9HYPH|nr:hypothetical protein [Ciceribacter thiooxidans]
MTNIRETIEKSRAASRGAMQEVREGISSIRARISSINDEIKKISRAHVPLNVATARIDALVNEFKEKQAEALPLAERFLTPDYTMPSFRFDMIALFLAADSVGEHLKAQVREKVESAGSIDDAERHMRLADLDRQLLDCELSEESIIRQAEGMGFDVIRRPDADPRAVLAHDKVLP